jgi:hypothetical protein
MQKITFYGCTITIDFCHQLGNLHEIMYENFDVFMNRAVKISRFTVCGLVTMFSFTEEKAESGAKIPK